QPALPCAALALFIAAALAQSLALSSFILRCNAYAAAKSLQLTCGCLSAEISGVTIPGILDAVFGISVNNCCAITLPPHLAQHVLAQRKRAPRTTSSTWRQRSFIP